MKKTLSLILAILMIVTTVPFAFAAEEYTEGDFSYTVENGEATITDYTGTDEALVIPDTLGGYPVTAIGEQAFYNCRSFKEVTIPGSVTTIGNGAFARCRSLMEVTISYGVTTIGSYAFFECGNLREINIPKGIEIIAEYAFESCSSLEKIVIPDGVVSIGEGAFCSCKNLKEITIPDSVTSIDSGAFADCENLREINIPKGIEIIAEYAFGYCSGLEKIVISDGVVNIGEGAFFECKNLKEITIPDSVTSIDRDAFFNCVNLDTVYYLGTKDKWKEMEIIDNDNEALTEAEIHCCEKIEKIDATCSDVGYTAGIYCSACEEYIEGHEEILATGIHADTDGDGKCDNGGEDIACPDCGRPVHGDTWVDNLVCWLVMLFNLIKSMF